MSILPDIEIKKKIRQKPFYTEGNIEYDLATTLYRKEIETDIIYFSLRGTIFRAFIRALTTEQGKTLSQRKVQKLYKSFSDSLFEKIKDSISTGEFLNNIRSEIAKFSGQPLSKRKRTNTVVGALIGREGTKFYKVRGKRNTYIGVLILSTTKSGAYQAFSDYIRAIVPSELKLARDVENPEKLSRGFDFAHVLVESIKEDGSVTSTSSPISEILSNLKEEVGDSKNIDKAIKDLLNLHRKQYSSLLNPPKATSKDKNILIEYYFLRQLTNSNITGNIGISILIPEYYKFNAKLGQKEKAVLKKDIKDTLVEAIKTDSSLIDKFLKVRTSPSLTDKIEEEIIQSLTLGRKSKSWTAKSKKYSITASTKEAGNKAKKERVPSPKKLTGVIKDKTTNKPAPIRNTSGQFTSLPKILTMLQGNINQQVASNMGSPRLNYRKGRFANSVKINNVNRSDKGQWTITYSYMTYPYQTFEPGYAQGSQARDPRALITLSIRELVAKEIGNNFKAVRIGGAGSLGRIK